MGDYSLSLKAEQDLLDIATYGLKNFGPLQSERYHEALMERFQELADHPFQSPSVGYIHHGYRRSVCGSHSIYYHVEKNGIAIMRILNRQDVRTALR